MKKVYLKEFLKPSGSFNLKRLGNNNDGGYLVVSESIEKSEILLSFGINDDWSFEKDFYEETNSPIEAFDASINAKFFIRNFLYSFLRPDAPLNFIKKFRQLFGYVIFFRKNKKHNQIMVGYDNDNSMSLKSVFEKYILHKYEKVFLKIDIESSEYRILDDIIKFSKYVTGIVIEFHDVDLHIEKIKTFVNKLPLNLAHCHANNYGGVDSKNQPLVVELTFSKAKPIKSVLPPLPNLLDMPNNKHDEEYEILFR
tara:strand:- start:53 stop:814 length:762 start_codon:yes stop_codon:yes gene_type:complete